MASEKANEKAINATQQMRSDNMSNVAEMRIQVECRKKGLNIAHDI